MTFSYYEYFINNLMLPIFALAFIAVPTFSLVRRLVSGGRVDFRDYRTWIFLLVMIVVAVILISSLAHGGIHLIYERSGSAVTAQGTVEEITKLSSLKGTRYTAYGETSFGYEYIIDGVACRGMAKGTLEVGDEVSVTYLPKSGFVLSIEEVE